jgi:hypothetical protein
MTTGAKVSRVLGWAFLFQFITSVFNGFVLGPRLIVSDNIVKTMTNIVIQPWLMKSYLLIEMVTAMGIIFLGAMLFLHLRKTSEKIALAGLGFYVIEAVLGTISRLDIFSLLRISQDWMAQGQPVYLQTLANIVLDSSSAEWSLMMVAFCPGAILFYYLLFKSRIVPYGLSLWGLITVIPLLAATLLGMFGVEVPIAVLLPYIPFEGVIAIWILVKGIKVNTDGMPQLPA